MTAQELFADWGPWFLSIQFLAVLITGPIPITPSEILVIGSGSLAAHGSIDLWLVCAVTFLGCLIGDIMVYLMFRRPVLRVMHRWRWGRGLHRRMLRITVRIGPRTTWWGLFLIRWIPGGRTASMAAAGMTHMGWVGLSTQTVFGAAVWSGWLIGLGWGTGAATGLSPWTSTLIGLVAGTIVGFLIAAVLGRRRLIGSQHREQSRAAGGGIAS
ncbi:DedA family protein [Nesterenkonia aerolata]|uniref:VTT domain-containing protein n=1 Tax=Nesterenkonia aerolata TaxID=3074079 RepID=A0ABU2DP60_9MICC|nr:VTT domain-containing protein [Nesterenkonia sp. LY-0111]MDR8018290.1 VTT domain-containing protein [Nesterenkonia sp. LY-0111]